MTPEHIAELLAAADAFVGQGGPLVEDLARVVRALQERIVTVDIDGRTIQFDKLAEAEAALDSSQALIEEIEAERDAMRSVVARLLDGWHLMRFTDRVEWRHPTVEDDDGPHDEVTPGELAVIEAIQAEGGDRG